MTVCPSGTSLRLLSTPGCTHPSPLIFLRNLALPSSCRKKAFCWEQQIYNFGNQRQEQLKEWLLDKLSAKCLWATSKIYPRGKGRNCSLWVLSLQQRWYSKGWKKTSCSACQVLPWGHHWGVGGQKAGEGKKHSACVLPPVLTPKSLTSDPG